MARQPVPGPTGNLPAASPSFTPGQNPGPFASTTAPDQIGLQPGLLKGEADIAKVEK